MTINFNIDKPLDQKNIQDEKIIKLAKNNVDFDLLINIQQGYKDWLDAGNEGSTEDYLNSLDLDELKSLSFKYGGIVDKSNKPKDPEIKKIDLTQELLKTADFYSRLSSSEQETLNWMIKKLSKND